MNAKICKELRHAAGLFPRNAPRVQTEYEPLLFRQRLVERMTLAGVALGQMAWPVAVKIKKGSPRHIYKALKRMHRRGQLAPASMLLGAAV